MLLPTKALTLRHARVSLIVLGPLKGDVLKCILKAKAGRQLRATEHKKIGHKEEITFAPDRN